MQLRSMSSCLLSARDYKRRHLLFPKEVCHVTENIKRVKSAFRFFNPNKMYCTRKVQIYLS